MNTRPRLELTWIGKEERHRLEPRIAAQTLPLFASLDDGSKKRR